ncbi:gluconate:H+ symporter [Actinotignum sp. GS-2025f]|uniref:Gluconate:H+ symporter (GntP) family transporter n=1 Tax=Actinotignum schaalii FB123-CNA-2 TaxID=883067 RepID=S2VGF7_9ACTO|nr:MULTISPECIES: gluconate:H+ symporter [Actinotignum]EPD26508.1 gluconate:H+ symporter (GntP) family transporter [Actinotignum schaalii FB123-CNA-2]MDK6589997.1 gluconate:H+ symporter [Actinotignum timonense]MDK6629840.1 gluconate:H+ symporter [Actinotignum timonense]MDY5126685.1 gluconate:H+ symporter [Actinotignum sp. SLA_B059]
MPIVWLLVGIALMLVLNIVFKVNSMLALLLAAVVVALCNGMGPMETLKTVTTGFGSTLGSLAIIVVFGAVIGRLMVDSGASHVLASGLIRRFGLRFVRIAVIIIGLIFGLAMFYEVAFLMIAPLVISIAQEAKVPWLRLAIPAVCATTVAHSIFPPQPGPVALIDQYHADAGMVYLLGIPMAILWVIVGGVLLPKVLGNLERPVPKFMSGDKDDKEAAVNPPSFFISLIVPLSPAIIMISVTIANIWVDKESTLGQWLNFFGSSPVAMSVALVLAMLLFGIQRGHKGEWVMDKFNKAVSIIAGVVMIIGAGGAFKQVVIDSGIGDYIGGFMSAGAVSPYIMAWFITVLIRLATGQGVVSAMTAASIIGAAVMDPTTGVMQAGVDPTLLVLATAAGSNFMTHINDASFWLFKEYFDLSIKDTLKTWGGLLASGSLVSLAYVMCLSPFFG